MESPAIRASSTLAETTQQQDLYKNLHLSSTHIRLLELLPDSADLEASSKPWYEHVNIRCNLIIVEIDKAPSYDALSYTWGNDDPSIAITLNGSEVKVRRNLADALAALRGQSSRLLWNDALCIDQTSDPERSHQVQLMGDIYRHASTVFVWLGRSEGRNEDLSSKCIPMLERFGDNQPTSKLPRAPPRANAPRESDFDEWIQDLKASYNLNDDKDRQRWTNDWESQYDYWNQMKKERMWTQMRRGRRPDLIAQLETSQASLGSLQEELQMSRETQIAQNETLAELQAQVHQYKSALDAPLSRLMKLFLARQEEALSVSDFLVRTSGKLSSLPVGPAENEQLYSRINGNLGEFQQYIYDWRQLLTDKRRQGFDVETELKRLEKWQAIEVAERRAFINLRIQYQSWYGLENTQTESLRRLKLQQDITLQGLTRSWDVGRKEVLYQGQDLSLYEARQRDNFKDYIAKQASALEQMTEEHHRQWVRSPVIDPKIDKFLSREELRALAPLKRSMRRLHEQLLVICMSETLARGSDLLSRQQGQLWYDIYTATQNMMSIEKERKHMRLSLIHAQGYWVQSWKMKRMDEATKWRRQVLQPGVDTSTHTQMLLALEEFCNLRYWNRLWIVQEVLLAKKLVLCFGDDARTTRDWSLLSHARRCLESIPADYGLDSFVSQQMMTFQQSVPFLLDRLRESRDKGWPLRELVEITEGTRCAYPRDKVYGLLGLANDCHKGDIVPDIKKSTKEVFLDTIRWYHQKYGRDDSYPSIIRLGKSMQVSFRTHDELPQQIYKVSTLDKALPLTTSGPQHLSSDDVFCVKATQKGRIMDLKQLLDDSKLLALRQRDWIGVVAGFLDHVGTQISRTKIEEELVRLSSIEFDFAIKHPITAYAISEEAESSQNPTLSAENLSSAAPRVRPLKDEQQFFMLDNGQFGVASTHIRENDELCEFEDEQTALILRPTSGSRFALISRAILSQLPQVPQIRHDAVESGPEDDATAVRESSAPTSATKNRLEASTINVHLDATSLQQVTEPYEISGKHKFREASFVHEADFGWQEFMNFGTDIEFDSLDASLFADESATENVSIPAPAPVPQTETPVPAATEKVLVHMDDTTARLEFKNPPLLEMLRSALSPRPFVSQWPQSESYGVLLDLGAQPNLVSW
ncbi:hypothetical protein E8E14_009779 [Neopestalotiopsis sp. 37M]|nr:hypothetical protein E8E14_009779 [Neopestalotiopsis sp. 37M]